MESIEVNKNKIKHSRLGILSFVFCMLFVGLIIFNNTTSRILHLSFAKFPPVLKIIFAFWMIGFPIISLVTASIDLKKNKNARVLPMIAKVISIIILSVLILLFIGLMLITLILH